MTARIKSQFSRRRNPSDQNMGFMRARVELILHINHHRIIECPLLFIIVTKVNSGDNATKIADAKGFFVEWRVGIQRASLNTKCKSFPKVIPADGYFNYLSAGLTPEAL